MSEDEVQAVLATPMNPKYNSSPEDTVGKYLGGLLAKLWAEGEGFSGKRPYGNSGWESEVYVALAQAGFLAASFELYDEDEPDEGEWEFDYPACEIFVQDLLSSMFGHAPVS